MENNKIIQIIISILIGIATFFNSSTIKVMLIGSLVFGFFTYLLISLIKKTISSKKISLVLLSLLMLISMAIVPLVNYPQITNTKCSSALSEKDFYFKTSLLSNKCEFLKRPNCSEHPWYYTKTCDLSYEQKISLIKSSDWYNPKMSSCNMCETSNTNSTCYALIDSEKIKCSDIS